MVSFTVTTRFAPEDREYVTQLMEPLTKLSRQEPGCVSYLPHWLRDEPATMMIYEQYSDEAALQVHRETDHFQKYVLNGWDAKVLSREYLWLDAMA